MALVIPSKTFTQTANTTTSNEYSPAFPMAGMNAAYGTLRINQAPTSGITSFEYRFLVSNDGMTWNPVGSYASIGTTISGNTALDSSTGAAAGFLGALLARIDFKLVTTAGVTIEFTFDLNTFSR